MKATLKFKKQCILLFCLCLLFMACACSNNASQGSDANKTSGSSSSASVASNASATKAENSYPADKIDVDLTALSSTMVYSEVYNMMSEPEKYKGKVVKMHGAFAMTQDQQKTKNYYACIIKDATACCSQGLEFELAGNYKYPDDYPQKGEDVSVIGTFDTYKEGDKSYCVLKSAEFA